MKKLFAIISVGTEQNEKVQYMYESVIVSVLHFRSSNHVILLYFEVKTFIWKVYIDIPKGVWYHKHYNKPPPPPPPPKKKKKKKKHLRTDQKSSSPEF